MTALKIQFKVNGRRFEGVDPRHEDEDYITLAEALRRTAGENGGPIKGEDQRWLRERQDQLPEELDTYWLVTNKCYPEDSQNVSCFRRYGHRWLSLGGSLFRSGYLVVRRLL